MYVYRSGDTLGSKAKIVIVDYQSLGDLKEVTVKYKKNGGFIGLFGGGTDEWYLDYIVVSQEDKR